MTFTWDLTATPVGTALAVFSPAGLAAFRLLDDDPEHELRQLAEQLGAELHHDPGGLAALDAQLEEYFSAERQEFEVALDWRLAPGFIGDALAAVREIPYGETAAYGEVAVAAGRPRAARAVGRACRLSPWSVILPVHRVVRSDGSVGEYGANPEAKRFLLELEGALSPIERRVRAAGG